MNTDEIEIRTATIRDTDFLVELGAMTFHETFADSHPEDDMSAYLEKAFNRRKIFGELNNKNTRFFIATINDNIVGYAKLTSNKIPVELKEVKSIEIERFYVLKKHIGKKIGKAMMIKSLEFTRSKGFRVIWLGTWKKNALAIDFYQRFGFEIFGTEIFILGKTQRDLYLLKKDL